MGLYLLFLLIGILLIPTLLSFARVEETKRDEENAKETGFSTNVLVYLYNKKQVIKIPLEKYVQGVVAAEMPANFHMEALKSQSLIARTYIVNRLIQDHLPDMDKWGEAAKHADVTDTVYHQAYLTDEQLRVKWGEHYKKNLDKINQAVKETAGQIITFQGKPIYAAFFSTSNGKTENSEEYFSKSYPYLRSVDSSWDRFSPKYMSQKVVARSDFIKQLGKMLNKSIAITTFSQEQIRVLGKTSGKRIAKLQIGNQTFTGREIREAFQLASSDFTLKMDRNRIIFTVYGYGHGVGLSQWGANIMAQRGKKMEEIILHYYQGVHISNTDNWKIALLVINRKQVNISQILVRF
ncbi:stage II sporulation protein D [Thermoflavimicrobium daqui]|uniref:Stage II sporulation protein D n=2 Tax=Thermoflavimicrobium daqui TaxID=2137476 RepID=A0A364K5H2_9BACL|nr:stage II sporulation protein D [Thermoflavimicrobium daqui]